MLERLAINAGFIRTIDPLTGETCIATLRGGVPVDADLRRFAALVAEECAKECDEEERIRTVAGNTYRTASLAAVAYAAARAVGNCAAAIRAKFKP